MSLPVRHGPGERHQLMSDTLPCLIIWRVMEGGPTSRNLGPATQSVDSKAFVRGACDVAGGAGSVNALPAGGSARLAPSFDAATPRNVTALVGKSAYLSCRVRNLGNRTQHEQQVDQILEIAKSSLVLRLMLTLGLACIPPKPWKKHPSDVRNYKLFANKHYMEGFI
ncbi:jg6206 [Pararge aegeria aegeria]|uniref:Jg6206 protein n=1 Tax=Pararge aegeria aegeria TaxID=348720 RepID=A0A8S4RQR2_9NEOP|nr:jg6206 [Pararge aegeria aegeria]